MPLDHGGEQHETAWLPPEFKREVLDLIHAGRSVAWRSASMASWGWSFRPGRQPRTHSVTGPQPPDPDCDQMRRPTRDATATGGSDLGGRPACTRRGSANLMHLDNHPLLTLCPSNARQTDNEERRLPTSTRQRRHRDWGSLTELRRAGADGGGTTGPISPSGASSRSMMTGAWALRPVPLRACRSTQAARTLPATGPVASTRSIRIPRSWWNMPAR